MKHIIVFILGCFFFLSVNVSAQRLQGDTVQIKKERKVRVVSPKKAAMLSAVFPGLGQIYNRKYWKLPIIYGGIGAMVYGLTWYHKTYIGYRNAYVDWSYRIDGIPENQRYTKVVPAGFVFEGIDEEWFLQRMENKKNSYRRDRDLMILGMLGAYVVNILDASVDAHLSDFDIGEDLSMKVSPSVIHIPNNNYNRSLGISCKLTF